MFSRSLNCEYLHSGTKSSVGYATDCTCIYIFSGNSCVSECKPGTYGDFKTRTCKSCLDTCETCKDNGLRCTSCSPNKQNNFLDEDQCVANCSKGVGFLKYLRLSGNHDSPNKGLLEIKYKGAWHTVCDYRFSLRTARVFCRELGYGQPIRYGRGLYGQGKGKILAMEVLCKGHENSFVDCKQEDWFTPGCSHYTDVGLWCQLPTNGYVVQDKCVETCPSGTFKNEQNVCELCSKQCLTCSEEPEHCLTCREPFFYNDTNCVLTCPDGTFPHYTTPRKCHLCDDKCVTCVDRADKCLSCVNPLVLYGTHCYTNCPNKMYRKGKLCVEDCDLKYHPKDKVCQLCPAECLRCISDTTCKACKHGFVLTKQGKCERSCPTGQYWVPLEPESVGIRLPLRLSSVKNLKYKGRLEIKHKGVWGSICNDFWSRENAEVACRQMMLGPPILVIYTRSQSFEELNISKIWMDDVSCKGTEERLTDCNSRKLGETDCKHSEDVHIECEGPGIFTCQFECSQAQYKSGTICKPCLSNCLNCSGTKNNCSSCREGYFLSGSECVIDCPLDFYKTNNRQCKPCHLNCWTCNGPDMTDCTSCKRPKILMDGTCVQNCSKGYYERGDNSNIQLWKKVGPFEGVAVVS